MLRKFVLRRIDRLEADLGVSMDYLRHMAREALPALFRFSGFRRVADYRRKLPVDAVHTARVATMCREDCGGCLQIAVNAAREAGLPRETIRAVIDERFDDLDPGLSQVARYASIVSMPGGDDPALREELRTQYGEEALVELALAIATARVFPTLKRGLGYATSCSATPVEVG